MWRPEVDIDLHERPVPPGGFPPHRHVALPCVPLEVRVNLRTEDVQGVALRHPRWTHRLPRADQEDRNVARAEARSRLPRNLVGGVSVADGGCPAIDLDAARTSTGSDSRRSAVPTVRVRKEGRRSEQEKSRYDRGNHDLEYVGRRGTGPSAAMAASCRRVRQCSATTPPDGGLRTRFDPLPHAWSLLERLRPRRPSRAFTRTVPEKPRMCRAGGVRGRVAAS